MWLEASIVDTTPFYCIEHILVQCLDGFHQQKRENECRNNKSHAAFERSVHFMSQADEKGLKRGKRLAGTLFIIYVISYPSVRLHSIYWVRTDSTMLLSRRDAFLLDCRSNWL